MKDKMSLKDLLGLYILNSYTSLTDEQMDDVYTEDVPRKNCYRHVI